VRLKTGVIISASGRQSFTPGQQCRLDAVLDLKYYARLRRVGPAEFTRLARPAQILGLTRRPLRDFGPELVDSLPRLESVAIYSTGWDWVDVAHLNRRGVVVSFLPSYSTTTVAEHTIGCMLALSRRILLSNDRARGLVPARTSVRGWELRGRRLGIIGFGRIGRAVGERAVGLGMEVVFHDPRRCRTRLARAVAREELLRSSDVVVLAVSRQRGAPPLIDDAALSLMRPGACLVNPARAALVDDNAVVAALSSGRLRGYAVDDTRPIYNLNPRLRYGSVLQTGHSAWYSDEALRRGTEAWVRNIVAMARGRPRNLVRLA
jgi:phosphoglycerate dehydrogenase-like enzyme